MPNHRLNHLVIATATIIALLGVSPGAQAQVDGPRTVAQEADSFYGREPTQGVYVRDSAVALEKFPLVARLERLGEWGKAADVLQEVLEEYPDRVIQTATNDDGEIVRYTSVANAVTQQIARWPAEGLAAYRARFELVAQARLANTDPNDIAGLRMIFGQYFNTEPGLQAGLRLVDLYFRAGDFRSAREVADRLLAWHPLLEDDRPALLYRAGLLAHLTGDTAAAQERANLLSREYPDARGVIGGQETTWAQSLHQELATTPAAAQPVSARSWPILGGDPSRARVSTATGRTGARLFQIPLTTSQSEDLSPDQQAVQQAQQSQYDQTGATIGVMPVADRNELFFQDGQRIYGVSLESGLPLPGWAQTHAATGGVYVTDAPPLPAGQQLNVTVTDDSVVAIMGFAAQPGEIHGSALSRIVCLDRATGRERWVVRPADLPDQDALRTLSFSGSPLVIDDAVHFIGRGGKGAQFEDCYLITLDLRTGQHKWHTYIASASTQQAHMFGGRGMPITSNTTSHVAYAGGRLFVLTNLGAIAAVDAYSGIIDWLSIYERSVQTDPTRRRRFGPRPQIELPQPWTFNPVMVQDNRLFILPTDANDLLIYDTDTGLLVKTIRAAHLDRPDTIVGIQGDQLVVSGGDRIKAINWQRYDPERYTDRNIDMIYWPRQFSGSPIRGRPFMTTESIFVPTQRRLYQMDRKTGKIIASHPADTADDWEGAGNVIVVGDRVIVATARSVDVYTDLRVAQAKLDAEVAAAPDDPQVRLRYAQVMFAAGQEALSLSKLDEAIELLGGRDAMRPGPDRDQLFYTALTYAQQLTARGGANPPPLAQELYDRAAAAAQSPSQQVQYRISRGELAMRAKNYGLVATLAQQILDDPEMRLVTISDPRGGGTTQAAVVAEHTIAMLIRQHGREVYAPFDVQAEEAVQAAGNDAEALLAIAARYPNARVAPQALLLAAQTFESEGNHRLATQTLRQIAHKFPDAFSKAALIEALARNYLAMPNRIEVAISRLEYGARIASDPRLDQPLTLPDGTILKDMTFSQAATALRAYADRAQRRQPPDFHLPTREWGQANRGQNPFPAEARQTLTEIDALVPAMPGYERHDRIVTWTRGGANLSPRQAAVYAVGRTEPLGTSPAITEPPRQAAWTDAGLLIWTPQRIVLLDPDNASGRWALAINDLPDVQLIESPSETIAEQEQGRVMVLNGNQRVRIVGNRIVPEHLLPPPKAEGAEQFTQAQITTDRALLITSAGRLVAINLTDGSLAWQTRLLQNVPIDRIVANDDFTVVRLIRDSRVDLVVFDTYSGDLILRRGFSTASGTVPLNFALAGDGTLVYVLPDRLCGKDLYDPGEQLSWEMPAQAPGQRVYEGATHPDHLKIHNGRILVLSDEGQFVRIHSLQTGRLIRYPSGQRNREVDALLSTGNQDWNTRLLIEGSYMYCLSPRALIAYNLENPEQTWRGPNDPGTPHHYQDALLGQHYLVLLDAPGAAEPQTGSPLYTLYIFSRAQTRNGESGLLVHNPVIQDRMLIRQWLGVEGGLYYLSGDRKLHFLKGIRE